MKEIKCVRAIENVELLVKGRDLLNKNENKLSSAVKVFNLAGAEIRLKILYLLSELDALCVCDLSDILEMKISGISQHLKKMKDGNLVTTKRDGQTIFYMLQPTMASTVNGLLSNTVNKVVQYEK